MIMMMMMLMQMPPLHCSHLCTPGHRQVHEMQTIAFDRTEHNAASKTCARTCKCPARTRSLARSLSRSLVCLCLSVFRSPFNRLDCHYCFCMCSLSHSVHSVTAVPCIEFLLQIQSTCSRFFFLTIYTVKVGAFSRSMVTH